MTEFLHAMFFAAKKFSARSTVYRGITTCTIRRKPTNVNIARKSLAWTSIGWSMSLRIRTSSHINAQIKDAMPNSGREVNSQSTWRIATDLPRL